MCTVPAFILEHHLAEGSGAACSILVTQPRRVSAIGVASRVAQEHCEAISNPCIVGYAIRGERRASLGCRLLFCTTGIVLRRLSGGDPDLEDVSHVFVDEVC
jgi:ATP-dependent RNA helicase DHX57